MQGGTVMERACVDVGGRRGGLARDQRVTHRGVKRDVLVDHGDEAWRRPAALVGLGDGLLVEGKL